uniref:Uncharacterized protein n=1 Tax=Marmota marmota marmota TaxID=9994 RepID=A0A8C5ZF03_MARMA
MTKVPKGRSTGGEVGQSSRKAAYIMREAHEQWKKENRRMKSPCVSILLVENCSGFKNHLDPPKMRYSMKDACEFIERYLNRNLIANSYSPINCALLFIVS